MKLCQDLSTAGLRKGLKPGTRSGLWSHYAYAIKQLNPKVVVIENVAGLLNADALCEVEPCTWCVGDEPVGHMRALGAVLSDLASLGFDAQWVFVHPVWGRPIDVSEYSSSLGLKLLGTPLATENLVGRPQRVETGGFQDLADQVAYLEQSSSKAASEDSQGQIMWDFS